MANNFVNNLRAWWKRRRQSLSLRKRDHMRTPGSGFKFGLDLLFDDHYPITLVPHGKFIFDLRDENGDQIHYFEKDNVITLDAGIQAARLFRDSSETTNLKMLAIGTGATGAVNSPDAPDSRQRRLNGEISRKAFASTTFRDSGGNAVAYPTNIVDYTTSFGAAEAVGSLNEMGLIVPVSDNPATLNLNPNIFPTRDTTLDISSYDVLVNYLTFGVVNKPAGSVLTITWRLTF